MRGKTAPDKRGPRVHALLQAGVPVGPLTKPNRFYRTSSGSKLHASDNCSRLSGRRRYIASQAVHIDLVTTPDEKFCIDCVTGPTLRSCQIYVEHARRVLKTRRLLKQLRAAIAADQVTHDHPADSGGVDGPEAVDGSSDAPAFTSLDAITRTSWHRVTEAKAVRQLIVSVYHDEEVHPDMREYARPVHAVAVKTHEHLEQLAVAATDDGALLRSCVVDLLGDLPSGKGPRDITAPVKEPSDYPAICTVAYGTRATGYQEKVNAAWLAWGDQVKLSGDLTAARADAMAAGSVATVAPEHVKQMPTGPARTEAPETGSPWDWLVAEWRLAATDELAAIVTTWESRYTTELENAGSLPDQVLGLREWDLKTRTQVNASTEVLSHLRLVVDEGKDYALLIAPAPVALWLGEFGADGIRHNSTYSRNQTKVETFGEATPMDSTATFETALRMWEPTTKGQRPRPGEANAMRKLATVLDIARGIHAADKSA